MDRLMDTLLHTQACQNTAVSVAHKIVWKSSNLL